MTIKIPIVLEIPDSGEIRFIIVKDETKDQSKLKTKENKKEEKEDKNENTDSNNGKKFWEDDPATIKQLEKLTEWKIHHDADTITKGEAHQLITKHIEEENK